MSEQTENTKNVKTLDMIKAHPVLSFFYAAVCGFAVERLIFSTLEYINTGWNDLPPYSYPFALLYMALMLLGMNWLMNKKYSFDRSVEGRVALIATGFMFFYFTGI